MAFGMQPLPNSMFSISKCFFSPKSAPPLASQCVSKKSKPTGKLAQMKQD